MGENISPNGGLNVETGDPEITTAAEYGQTSDTQKWLAYYKQSLIP